MLKKISWEIDIVSLFYELQVSLHEVHINLFAFLKVMVCLNVMS
jgi:hypothetical protein